MGFDSPLGWVLAGSSGGEAPLRIPSTSKSILPSRLLSWWSLLYHWGIHNCTLVLSNRGAVMALSET